MGGGMYMVMPTSFFFYFFYSGIKNEAQDAMILESDVYQGHGA
jgi:hypothetical protein